MQATILAAFADHLRSEGFTEIKTSKLIGTGTEGGTGLFAVEYFDGKVYLTQSPQLYKQTMVASGLERVFEIGPAYRAEKHDTPRHINEFVSLDVEMAWVESEQDLMDLETRILAASSAGCARRTRRTSRRGRPRCPSPRPSPASRACRTTRRARSWRRRRAQGLRDHARGRAHALRLGPEDRGHRGACSCTRTRGRAVRSTRCPRRGNRTHAFDLLFRGLEITSGGMRINRYDDIVESAKAFGLDPAGLADYLSIFKYGCPPHGGFAIGLERFTQKLLGLASVKEASLFPRDRKRTRP